MSQRFFEGSTIQLQWLHRYRVDTSVTRLSKRLASTLRSVSMSSLPLTSLPVDRIELLLAQTLLKLSDTRTERNAGRLPCGHTSGRTSQVLNGGASSVGLQLLVLRCCKIQSATSDECSSGQCEVTQNGYMLPLRCIFGYTRVATRKSRSQQPIRRAAATLAPTWTRRAKQVSVTPAARFCDRRTRRLPCVSVKLQTGMLFAPPTFPFSCSIAYCMITPPV
jgi:hypothetical protein